MSAKRTLLLCFVSVVPPGAAEDLTVLKPTPGGLTPDQQLEVWLKKEFYAMVIPRSEAFEKMIKSEESMRTWQAVATPQQSRPSNRASSA